MKRSFVCVLALLFALTMISGCKSEAETPVATDQPVEQTAQENSEWALTDEAKLKDLVIGETAVWDDYEIAVDSMVAGRGELVVSVTVKAHETSLSLSTDNMLLNGWECEESSFGSVIQAGAGEAVSGTFSFADATATRLFWNDGAIEATWYLDEPTIEKSAATDQKDTEPDSLDLRSTAESKIKNLMDEHTYYTFVSVDPSATFTEQDDGTYLLDGPMNILDGNGNAISTPLRTWWDESGECVSMELEGVKLF